MEFGKAKPGQLVEYIGPIPSVWKAYKFPASYDVTDNTGAIDLNIGDRFMVLERSSWIGDYNSTTFDVKILFRGVVKYLDIVVAEGSENRDEFRLVSS